MSVRRGSHAERALFWRGHVKRQRSLGVSGHVYCCEHGLSASSFYRWRRRLARAGGHAGVDLSSDRFAMSAATVAPPTGVAFAEVHVVGDDSRVAGVTNGPNIGGIEVVVSGGRRIRVGPDFDEATFLRVVALLEGRLTC